MGEVFARWAKLNRPKKRRNRPLSTDERKALYLIRAEARTNSAALKSQGRGGLPPSLVLGIFRRDEWRCKKCGGRDALSVHHKGHLYNPSVRMEKKGKSNDPNNIATICGPCHNTIHDDDRAASPEEGDGQD